MSDAKILQIITPVDVSGLTSWLLPVEPPITLEHSGLWDLWKWQGFGDDDEFAGQLLHADALASAMQQYAPVRPGDVLEFWLPCGICGKTGSRKHVSMFSEYRIEHFCDYCWGSVPMEEIQPVRRTVARVTVVHVCDECDMWPIELWERQHPEVECPEWVWQVEWE